MNPQAPSHPTSSARDRPHCVASRGAGLGGGEQGLVSGELTERPTACPGDQSCPPSDRRRGRLLTGPNHPRATPPEFPGAQGAFLLPLPRRLGVPPAAPSLTSQSHCASGTHPGGTGTLLARFRHWEGLSLGLLSPTRGSPGPSQLSVSTLSAVVFH